VSAIVPVNYKNVNRLRQSECIFVNKSLIMTIITFLADFPDEKSCRLHFKAEREKLGVSCKKCGCTKQYWLESKFQWQCADCCFRTTLRSGSIMQFSNLSLHKWYLCMALMSFSKKGISALEMQRQLGHKRYETIWKLMHKLRRGMGLRDDLYKLEGTLEFDEGYFSHATASKEPVKRGRGSHKKQNVAVIAESTPLENIETGKQSNHCRYFKMKSLVDHKKQNAENILEKFVRDDAFIISDDSTSYVGFSSVVEGHSTHKSTKEVTKTNLKWVHIAISNAKRNLLGTYHMVKLKYLQNYLDEFCYKINRRYFGHRLFDRLVLATASGLLV